jgi:hypothetical protein
MVQNGTKLYKMVQNDQNGKKWYKMVQNGTEWYRVVQNGTKWYKMVQMVQNVTNYEVLVTKFPNLIFISNKLL